MTSGCHRDAPVWVGVLSPEVDWFEHYFLDRHQVRQALGPRHPGRRGQPGRCGGYWQDSGCGCWRAVTDVVLSLAGPAVGPGLSPSPAGFAWPLGHHQALRRRPCSTRYWSWWALMTSTRSSSEGPVWWCPPGWSSGAHFLCWATCCLFCTSFVDFGTRFWSAVLTNRAHAQFQCAAFGSSSDWSETLSPIRVFDDVCRQFAASLAPCRVESCHSLEHQHRYLIISTISSKDRWFKSCMILDLWLAEGYLFSYLINEFPPQQSRNNKKNLLKGKGKCVF